MQSLQIGGMENFLSIPSDFTDDGCPQLFTSMMEEFETENRMAKRDVDEPRGMSVKRLESEGVFVQPPISIFVDRDPVRSLGVSHSQCIERDTVRNLQRWVVSNMMEIESNASPYLFRLWRVCEILLVCFVLHEVGPAGA